MKEKVYIYEPDHLEYAKNYRYISSYADQQKKVFLCASNSLRNLKEKLKQQEVYVAGINVNNNLIIFGSVICFEIFSFYKDDIDFSKGKKNSLPLFITSYHPKGIKTELASKTGANA
jgi:hypothetical protein